VPILAAVAHPDDEVLGAGGTLARHARDGEDVHVLFLTDGVGARGSDRPAADRRAAAARNACAILGAQPPRFLGFADNRLDEAPLLDVTQAIEAVIAELRPHTVYTHHSGDLNIDHVVCQRAVLTACRPMPGTTVRRIFSFEVPSSTEWNAPGGATFVPRRFVDISGSLATKRRALEAYAEEMRPFPHARSYEAVEALARWRGAAAGLEAAEGFDVIREIDN
jgi:LmbE family N-acetylglucosaminyl deacetylase